MSLTKTLTYIIRKTSKIINQLLAKQELREFKNHSSVNIEKRIRIRERIDFSAIEGSKLYIEDLVMLNSRQDSYPHYMHSPVKIRLQKSSATLTIGKQTRIHGSCITCYESISIGKRCLIAANCQIMDAGGHKISADCVEDRIKNIGFDSKPVIIEDDVWIGLNVIILPGVTIGKGSVIAAGSVVSKDIEAMVIAGGIPAKKIRNF